MRTIVDRRIFGVASEAVLCKKALSRILAYTVLLWLGLAAFGAYALSPERIAQKKPTGIPLPAFFDHDFCRKHLDGTQEIHPSHATVERAKLTCRAGRLDGISRYWLVASRTTPTTDPNGAKFGPGTSIIVSNGQTGRKVQIALLDGIVLDVADFPEYIEYDFAPPMRIRAQNIDPARFVVRGRTYEYSGERTSAGYALKGVHVPKRVPLFEGAWKLVDVSIKPGRHGVFYSYWPTGKRKAAQYWCEGLPVGFHVEYDNSGAAHHVVDYTKSDYSVLGSLVDRTGHRPSWRTFFVADGDQERPTYAIPPGPLRNLTSGLTGTQLFAQTFALSGDRSHRVGLAAIEIDTTTHLALPVETSLVDWTTPRHQMRLNLGGHSVRMVNEAFDYLPFDMVYRLLRRGDAVQAAGSRVVREMLLCPWIDAAMSHGLQDARIPLTPLPEKFIDPVVARARQRDACFDRPNVDCVLAVAEQLFLAVRLSRSNLNSASYDLRLLLSRTSRQLDRPRLALDNVREALELLLTFPEPNPLRAPAVIEMAEVARLLGDAGMAESALLRASVNARNLQKGYEGRERIALMEVGLAQARFGNVKEATEVFELRSSWLGSFWIAAEIARAHSRAGRSEESVRWLQRFESMSAIRADAVPLGGWGPMGEKGVTEERNAVIARGRAMLALAVKKVGDDAQGRAHLATAETAFSAAGDYWQSKLAALLAQARFAFGRENLSSQMLTIGDAIRVLIDQGRLREASEFLRARNPDVAGPWLLLATAFRDVGVTERAIEFANTAEIHARGWEDLVALSRLQFGLGRKEESRSILVKARRAAQAVPTNQGGRIDSGPRQAAVAHVASVAWLLEGGEADAPELSKLSWWAGGEKVASLLRAGQRNGARLFIDAWRRQVGEMSPGVHLAEYMLRLAEAAREDADEHLWRAVAALQGGGVRTSAAERLIEAASILGRFGYRDASSTLLHRGLELALLPWDTSRTTRVWALNGALVADHAPALVALGRPDLAVAFVELLGVGETGQLVARLNPVVRELRMQTMAEVALEAGTRGKFGEARRIIEGIDDDFVRAWSNWMLARRLATADAATARSLIADRKLGGLSVGRALATVPTLELRLRRLEQLCEIAAVERDLVGNDVAAARVESIANWLSAMPEPEEAIVLLARFAPYAAALGRSEIATNSITRAEALVEKRGGKRISLLGEIARVHDAMGNAERADQLRRRAAEMARQNASLPEAGFFSMVELARTFAPRLNGDEPRRW